MKRGRKAPRQSPSGTIERPSAGLDIYFLGAGASYVHGAPLDKSDPSLRVQSDGASDVQGRCRFR